MVLVRTSMRILEFSKEFIYHCEIATIRRILLLWVCDDGGLCTVWGGLHASCIFTCLRQCTMISQQRSLHHPFYNHVAHCPAVQSAYSSTSGSFEHARSRCVWAEVHDQGNFTNPIKPRNRDIQGVESSSSVVVGRLLKLLPGRC